MKRIKDYKKFIESQKINEEEGIKDIVAGAALLGSTLLPQTGTSQEDKNIKFHKKTHSEKESERYQKYGWDLDSVKVDTIYKDISPYSDVYKDTLRFDGDARFVTAKYELSDDVKNIILNYIDHLSNEEGRIITDYIIESSTDKEPIIMTNEVLSKKRADVVYTLLSNIGIDSSLITVDCLPNQGPDIYKRTMSKSERDDARVKTAEFRYVKIIFISVKPPYPKPTQPDIKKTYFLSKEKDIVNKPDNPNVKYTQKRVKSKVSKVKRENGRTKCEDFGNKIKIDFN